jgi:uncharacterized integral membrane protein
VAAFGALLKWIIILPVLVAVLLLAIANDQSVTVHFNPFDPNDPVLRVDLALYQLAFAIFVLGALAGALIAWGGQRKYRRRAQERSVETALWQARAERSERRQAEARPPSQAAAFLPRPERG